MKKYYFIALAAIAVLSSCSNKEDFGQASNNNQKKVFIGTIENNPTRATFDEKENCASWEVGDLVSINGANYSAKSAGTTTTFEAEVSGVEAEGELYKAYFPANLYKEGTPTLPTTQIYEEGKFNMPMYAESTTTNLEFKNICAVLAIKITSDDIATLKSIKVASDKKMNGQFTINPNNEASISQDDVNATESVVLESANALTLDEEGIVFYIAIPAQEYKYLNISLSADGETYTQAMETQKKDGLGKINRSTIYEIDYKKTPTTGTAKATIDGKEVDVKWAQLWAGGPKFAEYNVGVTEGKAENYGCYYTWGGTYANGKDITWKDDRNTGSIDLTGDTDTATKLWGNNWRMPTRVEFLNLLNECDCTWTVNYNNTGVNGLLCTGKSKSAYDSNSMFFPAAGYCDSSGLFAQSTDGYYFTSTFNSSTWVYNLYFSKSLKRCISNDCKGVACSVRAVLK